MKYYFKAIIASILVVAAINGYGQWEIVNENIAYDFRSVDFISKDTGWHMGEKGLFKTIDGAETWTLVNSKEYNNIDFYNYSVGWASRNGNIYKTRDGGKSWDSQYEFEEGNIYSISVLTDQLVYVFGDSILKTDDGGSNWNDITPTEGTYFINASFFHPDSGAVVGSVDGEHTIFRTFDGGYTWDRIPLDNSWNIRRLSYSSGTLAGFFVSDHSPPHESGYYITRDSFKSWSALSLPDLFYPNECHFIGRDTILILGNESGQDPHTQILRSVDGGSSWEITDHMQLPDLYRFWSSPTLYIVDNEVYLFYGSWGIRDFNLTLKSSDRGEHWKCLDLTFAFRDVHFLSRDKGYIVGGYGAGHGYPQGGYVFMTDDSGDSWEILSLKTANPVFDKIHFLNDSIGFFSGLYSPGLSSYTSTDCGEKWMPMEDIMIYDLHSVNDSVAWRLSQIHDGDEYLSQVDRTMDGGISWKIIYCGEPSSFIPSYPLFSSLAVKTKDIAFAVGLEGMIMRFTTNEATEIPSPVNCNLNKITFANEKYGWIAGGSFEPWENPPFILVTEDGGNSWETGPYIPFVIHDLCFLDTLHGFAVGGDWEGKGVILETFDRWKSWTVAFIGDADHGPLRALHFKDGIGWAVGDKNLIIRNDIPDITVENKTGKDFLDKFICYPNPFRSRTIISYWLPASLNVELNIHDHSGRKISMLVNETQIAGNHQIVWNADRINPGFYFCELKTGLGRQAIQLILIE